MEHHSTYRLEVGFLHIPGLFQTEDYARAVFAYRVLELSEADHITVRVIPFDLDGFAGAWSARMYAGGAVAKLDTAVRDAAHGTTSADSEAQLGAFRTLFRKVESVSLDPERSRDFIHRLTKEL